MVRAEVGVSAVPINKVAPPPSVPPTEYAKTAASQLDDAVTLALSKTVAVENSAFLKMKDGSSLSLSLILSTKNKDRVDDIDFNAITQLQAEAYLSQISITVQAAQDAFELAGSNFDKTDLERKDLQARLDRLKAQMQNLNDAAPEQDAEFPLFDFMVHNPLLSLCFCLFIFFI